MSFPPSVCDLLVEPSSLLVTIFDGPYDSEFLECPRGTYSGSAA